MGHPIVAAVREFVEHDVRPAAAALEHADRYPHDLVARMRELGLFGALVPEAYGGLGLDCTTYAQVIEEICRGFMSLAGVLNSRGAAGALPAPPGARRGAGRPGAHRAPRGHGRPGDSHRRQEAR